MNNNRPDIELLQQKVALFSDQQSYNELFLHFYASLQQFAYSYVKSRQLSEEVVSDVFIKIWEKRDILHKISNLKLYLFTSTRNTAINYLKKQKGEQHIPAEDYWVELNSVYFDPEKLMITAEMLTKIQKAIQSLPPRCKMIFKLVKEEELKYREVATLLDLSVKTVENQMTLALKRISIEIGFNIKHSISATTRSI
ncbi:MAG: RNA polymerase sigma-70 factor [Chitinophagaceae bacterium]|nr:RNA polymerase sigma-70 factor [Chitinophagaceae bacterium]